MRDELLQYLYDLNFFENDGGDVSLPYEFVSTYGLAPILAALKFSLYQRNISNPGGFLRNLIEAGDTGRLHPFIRKRLRGYVPRFERFLCPEEGALLLRWAAYDGEAWLGKPPEAEGVVQRGPRKRERISPTGCDCHDSFNEAYFRDHGSGSAADLHSSVDGANMRITPGQEAGTE